MGTADIIIGGQYGSEGKGKIAAYLSNEYDWGVRSGGPNSGHIIHMNNSRYKIRTLPSTFVNPTCKLAICSAGIIHLKVLLNEIEEYRITKDRLFIDPYATIIKDDYIYNESFIKENIGSTGQGVGIAMIEKIKRDNNALFAKDISDLQSFTSNVSEILRHEMHQDKRILLEGSQGFGLSLHHGYYPFVTSRDTTSGTLCGEIGIGIKNITDIILVLRTYPIRVGGNSGPLKSEVSWEDITKRSGSLHEIKEFTTVTNRLRRVGEFDIDMIRKSVFHNSATILALNFVDYLDTNNFAKTKIESLSKKTRQFIDWLEMESNVSVKLIGTGPDNSHIIDLR